MYKHISRYDNEKERCKLLRKRPSVWVGVGVCVKVYEKGKDTERHREF
jgi:hypothetical protein